MCQLLALTANSPTDITFSFEGFIYRAGITDTNVDGTGIAFFENNGSVKILKDDKKAVDSFIRSLVKIYQIKSQNIIAHIRRASQGIISLENTHPFLKEIWNENWVFAHNGHIEFFPTLTPELEQKVIGQTDSETFFVCLVDYLKTRFPEKPSNKEIFEALLDFCDMYATHGILNFVLSNGKLMFAHCSTNLWWTTRTAKDNFLVRRVDDGGIINLYRYATQEDKATVICTVPLTDEKWNRMENGRLMMFENGECIQSAMGIPSVISEKYEKMTGLSKKVKEQIDSKQNWQLYI